MIATAQAEIASERQRLNERRARLARASAGLDAAVAAMRTPQSN